MNRIVLGAMGVALLAAAAAAQTNYAAVQIKPTALGHRTWMLEGNGGNITVIAGDDAVIMVDTQFAPLHDKIKAAVAELTGKPIRYVVDTHLHGDHTGGNQAFWMDGATIVGQDLLKKSMAEGTTNALSGAKTPPSPASALPTITYADRMSLSVKGRKVELVHMPHAHTRGDTAVWVPDADVLATGDIVSTGGRYPNIDVGDAGGIEGMIKGVDAYLKRADAKTKIVPGHGALMDREGLKTYRQLLVDARDSVKALKAKGMSEDQAVAAKPLAAPMTAGSVQARAGATDRASDNFVRLIYRSVA
ncbi:MBL fold metallo-hydrolase [Phenylobacterium sp.]|jgi:glyoxylase-like metal-dependent hydrolase (beta-lactamase superfamily II)|uniref:MBL fold metallo-hydrolase n=1 Tax=Phenylobacterium sp. TaxID=1871053 RepID=UPI002F3F56E6